MPEDADREAARGILERFDRAVVGLRGGDEPVADPAEALVVARLDRDAVADDPAEAAAGLDRDLVVGELAEPLLVQLVAERVRQVLLEVAAARDVEHLAAAADRE